MADSKLSISICMGSSCFARGNDKNLALLEEVIKVNNLELKVDLMGSRCENICSKGPTIKVNDVYQYAITKEAIVEILKEYYPSITIPEGI